MPRPKLPRAKRRSAMTFVRLLETEKADLKRAVRYARKVQVPGIRTMSDVLRESFVAARDRRRPTWLPQ